MTITTELVGDAAGRHRVELALAAPGGHPRVRHLAARDRPRLRGPPTVWWSCARASSASHASCRCTRARSARCAATCAGPTGPIPERPRPQCSFRLRAPGCSTATSSTRSPGWSATPGSAANAVAHGLRIRVEAVAPAAPASSIASRREGVGRYGLAEVPSIQAWASACRGWSRVCLHRSNPSRQAHDLAARRLGFGIDVRWSGGDGNRRATVVRGLLQGAGVPARLCQHPDGRGWELRVGPVPGKDVARIIGQFVW